MTWLNEIEYIYLLTEKPPERGGRKAMAKMVRVLREQVRYIRVLESTDDPIERLIAFEEICSSDTKELLG